MRIERLGFAERGDGLTAPGFVVRTAFADVCAVVRGLGRAFGGDFVRGDDLGADCFLFSDMPLGNHN